MPEICLGLETVPNVPCGVERQSLLQLPAEAYSVPNVPCGVERRHGKWVVLTLGLFLMYRVELKVFFG